MATKYEEKTIIEEENCSGKIKKQRNP